MKNLTKLFIAAVSVAAVFIANNVHAQSMSGSTSMSSSGEWRMGIGFEPGVATGNYYKISSHEVGGSLRLQYNITNNLAAMATSGYNYFAPAASVNGTTTTIGGTTYGSSTHSQGIIPVKLGLKEFLTKNLYISEEAGVGFETQYGENKKLILSPGIGWAKSGLDVSAVYDNYSGSSNSYGLVGLRIAYGFKL